MQRCTLVLFASTLAACFSPKVDPNASGSGSDSDGASSGGGSSEAGTSAAETTTGPTTSPGTDTALDSTTGETTVAGDENPTVGSFTVNGSTEPAEVDEGGTITLEAEASDDVGVVGVEFFDGQTSLGVDADAPYELEVGVSSADSGSHAYRAVATDTVGQTGESDEVVLSINIVGGVVEILREDLFAGIDSFGLVNGRVRAVSDDRVVVTAAADADPAATGQVIVYNSGLSLIADAEFPEATPGPASPHPAGALIVRVDFGGSWFVETLDTGNGSTDRLLTIPLTEFTAFELGYPRVVQLEADVVATTSPRQVSRLSSDLSETIWNTDFGEDVFVYGLDASGDGSIFVAFGEDACAQGTDSCVRKISAGGKTEWTRALGSEGPYNLSTTQAATLCVVGVGASSGVTEASLWDLDGEVLATTSIAQAQEVLVRDVAGTADGCLLATTEGESTTLDAAVVYLDSSLNEVWRAEPIVSGTAMAFSVDATSTAVFAMGIANLSTAGFGGTAGDTWVARISL